MGGSSFLRRRLWLEVVMIGLIMDFLSSSDLHASMCGLFFIGRFGDGSGAVITADGDDGCSSWLNDSGVDCFGSGVAHFFII